jgi:ornithine--oxo-acid transaminase
VPFGDADAVAAAIDDHTVAVLLEPIQGEAGIVLPPAGYLAQLRSMCDQENVLLILDEVQSGLCRTGRWFAHQHEGIRPDGLILGKALGGGVYPVSAFLATRDVMAVFDAGSHGSTFGGNPLAAAIGLETLRIMDEDGIAEHSADLGRHMLERLRGIRSNAVTDVRGRGLWAGVELDPDVASARDTAERLSARGVLTKDTHGTVLRFAPPLTISRQDLDDGLDIVEAVLTAQE